MTGTCLKKFYKFYYISNNNVRYIISFCQNLVNASFGSPEFSTVQNAALPKFL